MEQETNELRPVTDCPRVMTLRKFPNCAAGRGTRLGSEASLTEKTELRFWGFWTAEFIGQRGES